MIGIVGGSELLLERKLANATRQMDGIGSPGK